MDLELFWSRKTGVPGGEGDTGGDGGDDGGGSSGSGSGGGEGGDGGGGADKINTEGYEWIENPNLEADTFDPLDMRAVFRRTPTCQNVKSLIQKIVEDRGHVLLMTPKYHCECAGVGIEYCFGRVKWWYNKHHRHTTHGLRQDTAASFAPEIVTLHHMRKFARKCRDFMRV